MDAQYQVPGMGAPIGKGTYKLSVTLMFNKWKCLLSKFSTFSMWGFTGHMTSFFGPNAWDVLRLGPVAVSLFHAHPRAWQSGTCWDIRGCVYSNGHAKLSWQRQQLTDEACVYALYLCICTTLISLCLMLLKMYVYELLPWPLTDSYVDLYLQ